MHRIYAQIEIINSCDLALARRNIDINVKRSIVNAEVSPNTSMFCINESIQKYLQLEVLDKRIEHLANDRFFECDVVGPVEIKFKNRSTICRAIVLPGNSNLILGRIPIAGLDVIVEPQRKELIINPISRPLVQMKMKWLL